MLSVSLQLSCSHRLFIKHPAALCPRAKVVIIEEHFTSQYVEDQPTGLKSLSRAMMGFSACVPVTGLDIASREPRCLSATMERELELDNRYIHHLSLSIYTHCLIFTTLSVYTLFYLQVYWCWPRIYVPSHSSLSLSPLFSSLLSLLFFFFSLSLSLSLSLFSLSLSTHTHPHTHHTHSHTHIHTLSDRLAAILNRAIFGGMKSALEGDVMISYLRPRLRAYEVTCVAFLSR